MKIKMQTAGIAKHTEWNHPLNELYYIDAIPYSVRGNGVIRKRKAYVILCINAEGARRP